jgi:hypothetical protein
MRSYIIALIAIGALIVGGTIGFFVTGFVTAGSVKKSATFYYDPTSPVAIESLDLYSDIGDVSIKYNTSNTPHYAEIDVNIEINGLFMQDKSYTAFFTEESNWWNPTTAEFTLRVKPDIWFDPSYWFKAYNVDVNVLLRTDIVYDLTAISSTGTVTLNALENSTFVDSLSLSSSTGHVKLNSEFTTFSSGIQLNSSTGAIEMYLDNCTLENYIKAKSSTGKVILNSENMVYTTDCSINLKSSTGSINANIVHHNDLNANITAHFESSTGSVNVVYQDYNATDGFKFISSTSTGSVHYTYNQTEATEDGNNLTSVNYNYPAVDTYTFTCITSTGSVNVDARSTI